MLKDSSYILNVGNSETERLNVLASIYNKTSQDFISRCLPNEIETFIDVGCGQGHMSFWLAENLKNAKIFGVDISEEQVKICNELKKQKNINNIEFIKCDLTSSEPLSLQPVDAIYCRYVLLHIVNWESFFNNILSLLKKGGSLIIEEPGFPFFTYPYSEALSKADKLGLELTSKLGMRFDCIEPLLGYVRNRKDLSICDIDFAQPTLKNAYDKSLLWRSFAQIKKPLLAMGMSNEEEFDEILSGLYDIANDPIYIAGALRVVQLHLQKCD